MQRVCVMLLLVSLAIVPAGIALAPAPASPAAWRWGLDHARYAGPGGGMQHVPGAIACPLGDVDGDGALDLLLRAHTAEGDELQALAGPAYERVLWVIALGSGASQLRCAPDADLDGIADPLVEGLEDKSPELPEVPGGVSSEAATSTLHAISGATGKPLVELKGSESKGGGNAAAASGSRRVDLTLEPAGSGVYLFVATEATEASAALPLEDMILSSGGSDVTIDILDAAGEVVGTIEAPEGSRILSHAGVPDATGAWVLVLSATEASPIDQLPARVPTVSAHDLDGSARWSTTLEPTTGALMLVPQAGDVDGDAVEDLIALSMPTDMALDGASAMTLLSGADGSVLLSRATEVGFLAALPLGDLTPDVPDDAEALLVIVQEKADGPLTLECIREAATCWTSELPATAIPVNGALDPFTGDLVGFHDLTGDGMPDVAALVEAQGEFTLRLISGADGSLVWSTLADPASQVHAVPGADGADLAIIVQKGEEIVLTLLDGSDAQVSWSVAGLVSGDIDDADVDVQSVLDDEGDTKAILATVREASPGKKDPVENVYELEPRRGLTRWSGTTAPGGSAPPPLELQESEAEPRGVAGVPGPAPLLVAAAIVGAAALARWARRAPKA